MIAAVFWLSVSALSLEVLLARVFALSQWHHLGFMVLSIALFGFAASGALLSLWERSHPGWEHRGAAPAVLFWLVIGFSLSALVAVVGITRLPLDYFRLPLEPIQAAYLAVAYLLLAVPFLFAGASISLAYALAPVQSGAIYLANMGGSALGAALPALLLPLLDEGRLVVLLASLPLGLLPGLCRRHSARRWKWLGLSAGTVVLAGAGFLLSPMGAAWIQVRPSPYKALPQALQYPDTRVTDRASGLRGRIDRVESPHLRFAPGLSLQFTGPISTGAALYRDAERPLYLYDPGGGGGFDFVRYTLPWAGYLLRDPPGQTLVVLRGGGAAIPTALAAGARPPTVMVDHPGVARQLERHYGWPVRVGVPRSALARAPNRYGIIHLENWGPSLPGAGALDQNEDATVAAFRLYLQRLQPGGVLVLARRLLLPPSDLVRNFATAYAALRAEGIAEPERHLAVLRNWDVYVLLVAPAPLGDRADKLRAFARSRNFDLVHLPGLSRAAANRFNVFDAPFHYEALQAFLTAARSGRSDAFFRDHPLDLAPRHDDRPFPNRFLKWSRLPAIYRSTGERFYTLMMSGELVVLVVLVESMVVALALLLPALVRLRGRRGPGAGGRTGFFLAVGAGFMLAELYLIKALTVLFADPVVSFAAVLAAVMVTSGAGGFLSRHGSVDRVRPALALLAAVLVALPLGMTPFLHWAIALPSAGRWLVGLLLPVPLGVLMGVPFAAGMRRLSTTAGDRAVAWAANGCSSVLASVAAAELALAVGISSVGWMAAAAYGLAFLCVPYALGGKGEAGTVLPP